MVRIFVRRPPHITATGADDSDTHRNAIVDDRHDARRARRCVSAARPSVPSGSCPRPPRGPARPPRRLRPRRPDQMPPPAAPGGSAAPWRRPPTYEEARFRAPNCVLPSFHYHRLMHGTSGPQITLEQADDGTFFATSHWLPGFVARGETEEAARRKIRKALKLHFREEQRDFAPFSDRGRRDEPFRWSRYRAPLYLRFPLSTPVKLTLAAFTAGVVFGVSALTLRKARR